ncbi:MAG: Fe-S cluster assembly sulfur transfer protein SufU [Peptidiphaga gingivicola]
MNDLDQMYQQIILDAAHERRGEGELNPFDGESFQVNPTCGDQVNLRVRMSDDGERIAEVAWTGEGCSISRASIGIMIDMLEGASVDEAKDLYEQFRVLMDSRGAGLTEDVEEALGDAAAFVGVAKFPMRIKCALLGWMALRDATDKAVAAKGESHG